MTKDRQKMKRQQFLSKIIIKYMENFPDSSGSSHKKFMDPDPNSVCPERLDPDRSISDRIRNPAFR